MPSTASDHGTVLAKPADQDDSGVFQTSPGLIRRRALGPWAEGIKQYLAIRLDDGARGRAAYRSLVRMVDALPPEELVAAPGAKAQLYRLARSVAQTELAMPGGASGGSLRWRTDGERGYARLRSHLSPREAEILELRHARELELYELAFVLELTEDEAELGLDRAEAHARMILGDLAPDPMNLHASCYVEAFALARSWSDDDELEISIEEEDGLELGTLVGGRYQLVDRVGVGAFGDVYRAEDVEVPGHQVALKLLRQPSLSESARQNALRELKLNAAVFHPSLVQFKDHGWFEQRLWFVMPWYDGETLEARMRRGPLSRAEARDIFIPLARALAALHSAGIRHQDIKPENIMLTELPGEGRPLPVLIDLGVAAEHQETMLGGTPLYFSPEVAQRFAGDCPLGLDVGPASDVFALALSLRNALEPDTQADVPAGAVKAFVDKRARELPSMPEARDLRYLAPYLRRWMSMDTLERPSAPELAEELAVLTLPEERRARRWKLFRWLAPLLVTLAVIFGAVVWTMQRQVDRGRHAARTAQEAAADARADLLVADARRRSLERGNASLMQEYQRSRLSRRELADELATTESQLSIVRDQLSHTIASRNALNERLSATRDTLELREATLAQRTTERDDARARAESIDRDRLSAIARFEAAEAARDDLNRELGAVRGRLAQSEARADAVEAELAEALEAAEAARNELADVRARAASLVEALSAEPAETDPEPTQTPEAPGPDQPSP